MKKLVTTLCTVAALAVVANVSFAANSVRISQVYGGGGGSGTYLYDYVELFNYSNSPVNVGNWAVEYGSATGNWGSSATNYYVLPAGIAIQPCSYLLIQLGAAGTSGAALPVTPDFTSTNISAGQSNGKIGLFNTLQANVACGLEAPGTLVDKVAYGTANCAEVTAVAALTNATVAIRLNDGLTDTDNNSADFVNPPPAVSSVTLHNAASGANVNCLAVPAMNSTWGQLKAIYR